MNALINIAFVLSMSVIAQCPRVEKRGPKIDVYSVDQKRCPIITYVDYAPGGQLSVYRCSKHFSSPVFWGWIIIKCPQLWHIISARNDTQTDIIFSVIEEILNPTDEKEYMCFPHYVPTGTSTNPKNGSVDSSFILKIPRSEMNKKELFRLFLIWGFLGMDFSKPINKDPLGVYLLKNNAIAKNPFSKSNPKVDFEPIAAFVTAPIFPKSATIQQQNEVIRYAKRKVKWVFLRYFKTIQRYFNYPQRGEKHDGL